MRTEPPITLQPRSVTHCLDLAVRLLAGRPGLIPGLTICIGLPSAALAWALCDVADGDLRTAVMIAWFGTVPLGALLILLVAPRLFGESATGERLVERLTPRFVVALIKTCFIRALMLIGPWLCLYAWNAPVLLIGLGYTALVTNWLGIRFGFQIDRLAVEPWSQRILDDHLADLIRDQAVPLFLRCWWIIACCGLMAVSLLATLECLGVLLFESAWLLQPASVDPVASAASEFGWPARLVDNLFRNPSVIGLTTFVFLVVYTIGRAAWFLSYVDLRIRRDCWDLELQFATAAESVRGVR